MVRILGEDPEAAEELAVSPSRRWTVGSGPRSPSSTRSRPLKVVTGPDGRFQMLQLFWAVLSWLSTHQDVWLTVM